MSGGELDPALAREQAFTLPSRWYLDPALYERERTCVLRPSWTPVARAEQVASPGDYVAGDLYGEPFVVIRGDDGELRAFFNVCRHHATCIVSGEGTTRELVCPYHGWTYDRGGRLLKAPRLGQVTDFRREEMGLVPMDVTAWGPFVFARVPGESRDLAALVRPIGDRIDFDGLTFAARREWTVDCNWKVFVDNYLDGGYHVEHLHGALAGQLDLERYRTELFDGGVLQTCPASGVAREGSVDFAERLGQDAAYVWLFPTFMINRYGPMMDTNLVVPLGPTRTLTVFDYYVDESLLARDPTFLARALSASARVQEEDIAISESVQRGLASSAYDTGRYGALELGMHHFHRMLFESVQSRAS